MRFRNAEDERRYNLLRVEMYLRLARHMPPAVVSEVLRNFGKLEALLYGEGAKQGLAIARIAIKGRIERNAVDVPNVLAMSPAEALAAFYGESDTPLSRVEDAYVKKLGLSEDDERLLRTSAWLRSDPVVFPPQTLAEATSAYGADLEPSDGAPTKRQKKLTTAPPPAATTTPTTLAEAEALAELQPDDDIDREMETRLDELIEQEAAERVEHRLPDPIGEAPAFLDLMRDELLRMMKAGWTPKSWSELVLGLHREMQCTAEAIDFSLASAMGRTVLLQVGLPDIAPGAGVFTIDGRFAGVHDE